ncbi:MAG: FAD:protein FMN transferase [Myxococcota bacterium]
MGSSAASGEGPGVLRRIVLPAIFVVALFVTLYARQGPSPITFGGDIMGTTYRVHIIGEGDKAQAEEAVAEALESVNASMSTYQDDSELMKFNASQEHSFEASAELRLVIETALDLSEKTGGAFDVTIGPVVNAYGFGPKGAQKVPTDEELQGLLYTVGHTKLSVDKGKLSKELPQLFVDLSAIAKGYAVDKAADRLHELGFTDFMVEVGGEVRARGVNADGEPWQLGVETPTEGVRKVQRVVPLSNKALATSGDYRNYFEQDGVRISHTIDARTGRPITHKLASVSVVYSNCMLADAWATALNVLGEEEGLKLANEQGIAALFIVRDGNGFTEIESEAFTALTRSTP